MPIIVWNRWLFVLARNFQPLAEPIKCIVLSVYELYLLNTYAKMEDKCLFTAKFVSWTVSNLCLIALKVLQKLCRPHHSNCFETSFRTWAIFILKKFEPKVFFLHIYLDNFEKFPQLFPAYGDACRNRLFGKKDISEREYEKAMEFYTLMRCNNFGDYHDFYLTLDVYLLADISEAFRSVCLKEYHLDPVHIFSAPYLSWEGLLNTTKVDLSLLSDIDMLLFCERAICGGINWIGAMRHFKANKQVHGRLW